jgi:hypothetical protein
MSDWKYEKYLYSITKSAHSKNLTDEQIKTTLLYWFETQWSKHRHERLTEKKVLQFQAVIDTTNNDQESNRIRNEYKERITVGWRERQRKRRARLKKEKEAQV